MKQRPHVQGAPLKAGGGHDSSMSKNKRDNELKEPGQNKYGSNTMSPCAKEGRINTYGE